MTILPPCDHDECSKLKCSMTPKLSFLTQKDKIRLAAGLDGWKLIHEGHPATGLPPHWQLKGIDYVQRPRYDASYDAIIPLIQKQEDYIKLKIEDYLETVLSNCFFITATPSQLLDALLVATGKAEL